MKKMNDGQKKKKIARIVFLLSFILPVLLMSSNLLYDEFWTLLNFVPLGAGQILTDLSLPNNHPLNTLMMKTFLAFSEQAFFLRLPSLICGAFIPVLCGELAWKWSRKNNFAAFLSAAILAMLSMPLIAYSGQARGYALQMFFLLLCILGLSSVSENSKRAAVLCAVGGIGTFLSVPNGALFLLPAGIGYLFFASEINRKNRDIWIAAAVIAIFGGIFYGINFSALQSAQIWGEKITSFAAFGTFFKRTMSALTVVPSLVLALCCLCSSWKRAVALFLLFIPVILAVFSNAGPERCYLYFSAALAVAGGVGAAELSVHLPEKYHVAAVVAVSFILGAAAFAMQYKFWKVVDYTAVFEKNFSVMPEDIFPVYRASSGYPVRCGTSEKMLQEFNYHLFSGNFSKIAFFECENGFFNGLDPLGSETVIASRQIGESVRFSGIDCRIYPLEKVEKFDVGFVYLIMNTKRSSDGKKLADYGKILLLNPWLISLGQVFVFQCEKVPENFPLGTQIYRIGR